MSFAAALKRTLAHEGGWYDGRDARDPNPTMKGVTQKAYDRAREAWKLPHQTVRMITEQEVERFYHDFYWVPAGCAALTEPLDAVHFDFYVNTSPHVALGVLGTCNNDPCEYLNLRERFYVDLGEESVKLRRNFDGWENRVQAERKAAGCYVPT
jgi:lysozyme family protein